MIRGQGQALERMDSDENSPVRLLGKPNGSSTLENSFAISLESPMAQPLWKTVVRFLVMLSVCLL